MRKTINMYFAAGKSCNLGCKYCYLPSYNKNQFSEDDKRVLQAIDDLLKKIEHEHCQIGSFCFHGAEPTLLSPLSLAEASNKIYHHWQQNGQIKNLVSIQSNGTLLTRSYLETLQSNLIDQRKIRLGFSIDPPRKIHNEFRNNSFDLVEKNLRIALDLGFPVSILSVVTTLTLEHIQEFTDWILNLLEMKKRLVNLHKVKLKFATGEFSLSPQQFKSFGTYLMDRGLAGLVQILTPGYCIQSGNDCEWYEFDVDGACYSCNKNFHDAGNFASWRTDSFKKIFFKRAELFSKYPQHKDCCRCPHQLLCNSGCPADRVMEGADMGKAHECELIKSVLGEVESRKIHLVDFYNRN